MMSIFMGLQPNGDAVKEGRTVSELWTAFPHILMEAKGAPGMVSSSHHLISNCPFYFSVL